MVTVVFTVVVGGGRDGICSDIFVWRDCGVYTRDAAGSTAGPLVQTSGTEGN